MDATRRGALAALAAFAASLSAPLAARAQSDDELPPAAPGASGYTLGVGDRVRMTVFGEPDLSGEFQIDGQGEISIPLIGAVRAVDRTTRSLENHVAGLYGDGYLVNPQVSVEVLNFRPFFILGEVNRPGSYPYREGLTVLNAVALAGGFTFRADEDDIEITRGGEEGASPSAATLTTPVGPGDLIRVTERLF
ncbi:MAG: polysaccharide biosynthesis/export family protein [Pseudomonadota bacterium]